MPTKEIRDQYLEEVRVKKSESYAMNSRSILNRVTKYEEEIGKTIDVFSEDDFEKMFEENRWIGSSNASAPKTRINDFIRWDILNNGSDYSVGQISIVNEDVNPGDKYGERYFESEDDFVNALMLFSTDEKYYRATAACAMYWLGFSQEETLKMKKSNLNDVEKSVLGRRCSSKLLYNIIKRCALSTGYDVVVGSHDSVRRVVYVESDLILRQGIWDGGFVSNDSVQAENLNNASLSRLIRELNLMLADLPKGNRYRGKKLSNKSIYMNSKFCRMYETEKVLNNPNAFDFNVTGKEEILSLLKRIIKTEDWDRIFENRLYSRFFNDYTRWKSYFHKQ